VSTTLHDRLYWLDCTYKFNCIIVHMSRQHSLVTAFPTPDPKLAKNNPYQGSSFLFLVTASTERGCLRSLKPQKEKSPVKPCIARKHLLSMYCYEIAPSTNAATSQSSLEAQLAKNAKMRVMYIYQSFIFEAIVGSKCRYRLLLVSSLPVRSKLPPATKASTCSKQEARKRK
jgi:hypothetical protein